jgi:hypothetical protein
MTWSQAECLIEIGNRPLVITFLEVNVTATEPSVVIPRLQLDDTAVVGNGPFELAFAIEGSGASSVVQFGAFRIDAHSRITICHGTVILSHADVIEAAVEIGGGHDFR